MIAAFLVVWLCWLVTLVAFLGTRSRLLDERRFNDRLLAQIERQKYGERQT